MGNERTPKGQDGPSLVRHKIPSKIQKEGKNPVFHVADEKEYYFALRDLLNKKVSDLLSSSTREDFINDAADLLDALDAMMKLSAGKNRITFDDIDNMRSLKQTRDGIFSRRIILDKKDK